MKNSVGISSDLLAETREGIVKLNGVVDECRLIGPCYEKIELEGAPLGWRPTKRRIDPRLIQETFEQTIINVLDGADETMREKEEFELARLYLMDHFDINKPLDRPTLDTLIKVANLSIESGVMMLSKLQRFVEEHEEFFEGHEAVTLRNFNNLQNVIGQALRYLVAPENKDELERVQRMVEPRVVLVPAGLTYRHVNFFTSDCTGFDIYSRWEGSPEKRVRYIHAVSTENTPVNHGSSFFIIDADFSNSLNPGKKVIEEDLYDPTAMKPLPLEAYLLSHAQHCLIQHSRPKATQGEPIYIDQSFTDMCDWDYRFRNYDFDPVVAQAQGFEVERDFWGGNYVIEGEGRDYAQLQDDYNHTVVLNEKNEEARAYATRCDGDSDGKPELHVCNYFFNTGRKRYRSFVQIPINVVS